MRAARISDLEVARKPLCQARINLDLAEADLNGVVTRLSAGEPVSMAAIRDANARVVHARHEIDRVRFASLECDAINGRNLCTNDPDDMSTALIVALERIEERRGPDLSIVPALGPDDALPRVGSFW